MIRSSPMPIDDYDPKPEGEQIAILALSQAGLRLGQRLADSLGAEVYPCKGQTRALIAQLWPRYRGLVCIMASGIVVRAIAPLVGDKASDPAVVVCDERGRFAISLLSGHLGGANALAERVAAVSGAQAVLTTASDVLGLSALDLWCRELNLSIADKKAFTKVMGKLVDQGFISLWSAFPLPLLAPDLRLVDDPAQADLCISASTQFCGSATLLHPKSLIIGLGCNRNTPASVIAQAIETTCAECRIAPVAIARIASIDLKADEPGLLAYAAQARIPLSFFNKTELNQVEGIAASPVVLRVTGAKAVAEPAALLAAGPGGRLLAPKRKWPDVTVAVAERCNPFFVQLQGGGE